MCSLVMNLFSRDFIKNVDRLIIIKVPVMFYKGCHTHNFCTMICDHGQNKSQRSNQNIRHSQWSSQYISLIFSIKLVKVKGMSELKPRIIMPMECNKIIFWSRLVKAY